MLTKQFTLDSSLNGLSFDGWIVQIDLVELPLASFLFVLTLYWKSSSGRGSNTVLCTSAFQEPLWGVRNYLEILYSTSEIFHEIPKFLLKSWSLTDLKSWKSTWMSVYPCIFTFITWAIRTYVPTFLEPELASSCWNRVLKRWSVSGKS